MKTSFLIILGMSALAAFTVNQSAHGMWFPLSPEELLEQSDTVFVGTVSAIAPVDVEYESQIARDGTVKEDVGPETMTLEEYTVNVEEFLKNPQETDTMKVLRATVSGVPGTPAKISGFAIGDRVLFYLPKDERHTHFARQYLPESFKIPKDCDAESVIAEPRIQMGNAFVILQDGLVRDDSFVAGKQMKFVYGKDMRTLQERETLGIHVAISKTTDQDTEKIFEKDISAYSQPCKWIVSAEWEFTPDAAGEYRMFLDVKENDTQYITSNTGFSVISEKAMKYFTTPIGQFYSGIPADEIRCKDSLVLVSKYDGTPACIKPDTIPKLIERGWTDDAVGIYKECSSNMREHTMTMSLSEKYLQSLVLFMQPGSEADLCVLYRSSLENSGYHTLDATIYAGGDTFEEYKGRDISVTFEPKTASMERSSKTLVKYSIETAQEAGGIYWIGIDQLGMLPIVIWDEKKTVDSKEIQSYHEFQDSESKVLDSAIVGVDGDASLDYALSEIRR